MINKKKLIIIGAGQFGILVSRIINKINRFNIIGFIDNDKKKIGKKINKIEVIGTDSRLNFYKKKKIYLVIALGNIEKRKILIKKYKKYFIFPKIISENCKLDETVKIGEGTIITNHTIILNHSQIGRFCLIGSGNKILHNVNISNNCVIGGGSVIGSNVTIKKNVFVGVGTVFASKKIIIGNDSFVCSGSAVFNNIESKSKVIGNPARSIPFIKKNA